jgi:hypothetical protein
MLSYNEKDRQLEPVGSDVGILYCNSTDIEVAKKIYSLIYKSNELGLTPECLNFYEDVVEKLSNNPIGATLEDFHREYHAKNKRKASDYRLKGMLRNLETTGLISKDASTKPNRWHTIKSEEPKEIIVQSQTQLDGNQ